jgi:hypothetical protein
MAADIPRTARDDARDALRKIAEAELALYILRQHLERVLIVGPEAKLAATLQARRCAGIAAGVVGEARQLTADAVRHAEVPTDALPA